jgi:putative endonuclease
LRNPDSINPSDLTTGQAWIIKMVKTKKQEIGELGENIACEYLERKGFDIIGRNYRKKWGEIDIVAEKDGILHFIEVKSVSVQTLENVIRETEKYQPEDNVHPWKLKRLHRAIQTYLLEKNLENEWQLDVMAVFLDMKTRKAKVRITENVII